MYKHKYVHMNVYSVSIYVHMLCIYAYTHKVHTYICTYTDDQNRLHHWHIINCGVTKLQTINRLHIIILFLEPKPCKIYTRMYVFRVTVAEKPIPPYDSRLYSQIPGNLLPWKTPQLIKLQPICLTVGFKQTFW